jgi:prepilin-type N-terminal cleavage/methylation domain-containing protein
MARARASASCRRADGAIARFAPRGRAGFTLVELLVVLTILGSLVALAFPGMVRLYATVRATFEQDDIERQLLALPQQVRESGEGGVLIGTSQDDVVHARALTLLKPGVEEWPILRLALPAGWSVTVPKPIYYHFTGMCEGGEVSFALPPVSMTYQLLPPLCRPRLADASQN